MYTIEAIQNLVEQALNKEKWDAKPAGLYEPVAYVLGLGGKRIRPSLLLLSANLFTEKIHDALPAALGIEIFHNFTLLHDDIMDEAPLRRNKPTVHKKWNENTAILSGDAMLIKAYQYISAVPADKLSDCLAIFSQTALEVCEGQQYDMDFETRKDVTLDEYLEMIRLKTAVLLAASVQIGALIVGAEKKDAQLLYTFGLNIGLAFQLKDDLLDVYGDSATFGKQIGGDIVSNKKTFLLLSAYQNPLTRVALEQWILKREFDATSKIQAVREIYNQAQVKALCEDKMNGYYDAAMTALDALSVPNERKSSLRKVANQLMCREI